MDRGDTPAMMSQLHHILLSPSCREWADSYRSQRQSYQRTSLKHVQIRGSQRSFKMISTPSRRSWYWRARSEHDVVQKPVHVVLYSKLLLCYQRLLNNLSDLSYSSGHTGPSGLLNISLCQLLMSMYDKCYGYALSSDWLFLSVLSLFHCKLING